MVERILVVGPKDCLAMVDDLAPKGFEIVKALHNSPEQKAALPGAHYFVGFVQQYVTPQLFKDAPRLKLIQLLSAGYDRADLAAARDELPCTRALAHLVLVDNPPQHAAGDFLIEADGTLRGDAGDRVLEDQLVRAGHLDDPENQDMVPGKSYLFLRPDRDEPLLDRPGHRRAGEHRLFPDRQPAGERNAGRRPAGHRARPRVHRGRAPRLGRGGGAPSRPPGARRRHPSSAPSSPAP